MLLLRKYLVYFGVIHVAMLKSYYTLQPHPNVTPLEIRA